MNKSSNYNNKNYFKIIRNSLFIKFFIKLTSLITLLFWRIKKNIFLLALYIYIKKQKFTVKNVFSKQLSPHSFISLVDIWIVKRDFETLNDLIFFFTFEI